MSKFFSQLEKKYNKWNDIVYKYALFLYYLDKIKKPLFTLFLGILSGLALPPAKLFFVLIFTIPTLIRLTDFCQSEKQAFMTGFWFCLGFFLVGFYWIGFAVLHDKDFLWLFPFALLGIPVLLALYTAILFSFYYKIVEFSTPARKVMVFSCLWVLFEYGRYIMFQFPWNFIGYTFTASINMLQITSIIGILGLSFFTILWASSFNLILVTSDGMDFVKHVKFFIFINCLMFLFFLFGLLKNYSFKEQFTDLTIRIVQGNSKLGDEETKEEMLERHIALTKTKLPKNIDFKDINYIIWPEGGVRENIILDRALQTRLAGLLTGDQILAINSVRVGLNKENGKIFNSIFFVNGTGNIFYYDKTHLVPFGEFVPFRKLLFLNAVASKMQDFTRGSGMRSIKLSSKAPPFSPLLCYEVAFTGNAIARGFIEPEWILNLTNDAWYLTSSAPFQHLEIARVRAIEEGLPLVRAANSGFSALINENGNIIFKTGLFSRTVVDFKLPKKQNNGTFFSIFKNIPVISFILLFLLHAMYDFIYTKHDKSLNRTFRNLGR